MWMKWVQELYINSTWHHINAAQHIMYIVHASFMDGWLGFNGTFKHASSGYIMPEEVC